MSVIIIENEEFIFHEVKFKDSVRFAIAGPVRGEGKCAWHAVSPAGMNEEEAKEFLKKVAEKHLKGDD
ncbi:hypothetical protein COY52_10330 [Candidatus Desantisbacteria bacterium CG_4_10_14_0_8_um_filter_48_22]|uniref:Uncharacterized protein n=1 Tax=Candidatus Desantisbacteria bacterium CG_4_10_14_0_8_um_filter_48_22 TaxID=1974543 RepID=A0A2M7S6F3_9BACT|nr:MAG: hypothetical protein COY52_10330 [Candidatus Desantisbacteria bacterium CG_4_10_14_0_8_um_filter_48_22]